MDYFFVESNASSSYLNWFITLVTSESGLPHASPALTVFPQCLTTFIQIWILGSTSALKLAVLQEYQSH